MTTELSRSYAFCGELSRREARNFYYSFRMLPRDRRDAMCALYAFFRHTDDIADDAGEISEKRRRLDAWRSDFDRAISGSPDAWPGLPALVDTAKSRNIPVKYLVEVIDGVEMDLSPREYERFEDLRGYCYRVASAVGLSCLHIWDYRSAEGEAEAAAEACGIALQLTNIIRDVAEDARGGRVYLPREDRERFEVSVDELTADRPSDRLKRLLSHEAERARTYYERGAALTNLVERPGRCALGAIVGIYRALLDEIERRDFDVLSGRVSLPAWRKTAIALRAWFGDPRWAR